MTLFYGGAVALVLLGLFFALWPIIKTVFARRPIVGNDDSVVDTDKRGRQSTNVDLYKDHLSELENSLNQESIDQKQFDQLKLELERNLLEDNATAENGGISPLTSSNTSLYIALVVVLIPVMAFVVYQQLGNMMGWQLQEKLQVQSELESKLISSGRSTEIQQALHGLNRQIVADLDSYSTKLPENLDIKVLLARNAMEIGQYDKAIEVYQEIIVQQPQAAQIIAELAQATFLKANNRAVPIVGILAERALSIQPNNLMALGLMGIANFQSERYQQAINYWQQAISIYPPGSANARALQNGIDQAQQRLSQTAGAETDTADANDQQDPHNKVAAKLKVAVSLGAQVPAKPEYTVFIYARAWQGAKIPLAITRISAAQLPLTIELNDSMAMSPGMNLSSADKVEIIARLSPSGNAITQKGDWQASIGPVNPKSLSSTVYPLVISQPVK